MTADAETPSTETPTPQAPRPPTPDEARAALAALVAEADRREIACNDALRAALAEHKCKLTVREFPEHPLKWNPDGSLVTRYRPVFEALPL